MRNLQDPRLLDRIRGLFVTWGIDPRLLELEITESALMENPAGAREIVSRLHDRGIAIAIGDFGTGYSSLSYLQRLPVDAVKIDQSFVLSMAESAGSAQIVRSIVGLAHSLGLNVVAEGVESREVLERLAALTCNEAQGYHIARPMPVEEFPAWFAQSSWA